MAAVLSNDTHHEDMIHDLQYDYYGRRLASCSSDRLVKVFDVLDGNRLQHVADLKGHEGPVWQVAWGHPKFGSLIASCSYDRKVCIWRESPKNIWTKIHEYGQSELSVNSVAWAPYEFGLCLACGSADGSVSVLTYKETKWDAVKLQPGHHIGVNAVSWAPASSPASLINSAEPLSSPSVKRFVSGGGDNLVKIWRFFESESQWRVEENGTLEGHTDWVRDVAWAPNVGLPSSTIASCSQDGTVFIWSQEQGSPIWVRKELAKFKEVVWRVSWSVTGNILAVSGGDNKVTLWKESLEGEWKQISLVDETSQ